MMRKILSPIGLPIAAGVLALGIAFLIPWMAPAEIESAPAADYTWAAPETGTPVDHYVVQVLINDVDIVTINPVPSEFVSITVDYGNKYRVRAAAVDAQGVQGPFSPWSIPFTPELAPPEF